MNILEAKQQIGNAVQAYLTKDEYGDFIIPIEHQRPIFMMGPPGIGKTAIMEQIAKEIGINLVTYSMTHHTRQSALGLPFIEKKIYNGKEYTVSEYTMSEIIASVYNVMEETHIQEGILFLDEINCVSETLAPAMLQFLQYKVFGSHKIPNGWVIVTAGNPPEYNNSVNEFDIVTWDRLKRIDVKPDYDIWKQYAKQSGVHSAITSYLEIKKDNFYSIQETINGPVFVTARGWVDLSDMLKIYELHNFPVNYDLFIQYLQNKDIAKDFEAYYDLFKKYKSDYKIDDILEGTVTQDIIDRAINAAFDERYSVLGLLLETISTKIQSVMTKDLTIPELQQHVLHIKNCFSNHNVDPIDVLKNEIQLIKQQIEIGKQSSTMNSERININNLAISIFNQIIDESIKKNYKNDVEIFNLLKSRLAELLNEFKINGEKTSKNLSNILSFIEKSFGTNQEMVIFLNDLAANNYISQFLGKYGCKEYFNFQDKLLIGDQKQDLLFKIKVVI